MRSLAFAAAMLLPVTATAAGGPARPYIEVGSPDFHPLPIAVSPFRVEGEGHAVGAELSQVLRDDLSLSGLFDVLDPKSFLADPKEGVAAPSIKFSRWSDVGADGLVKAVISRKGDEVTAEFHLYEVKAGKELLKQTWSAPLKQARSLSHRFADAIFEHYTQEPGVFRTRIAFVRKQKGQRDVMLCDADGKGAEVLYHDAGINLLPAWKPDGSEVMFTSYRGGRPELWAVSTKDHSVRKVVGVGELSTGGSYSPDGKRIAFTVSSDGNSDIWVAGSDGSDPKPLTRDPGIDTSPSWSPDGKRIAFVSTRSGNPHVYVMNADGSDQKRLTFQGNYNQTPRWSPRGDLIAFTARDERNVFDIFTVSPETGKVNRVTQDQGTDNEEPSWAANGRLLVFGSNRNGRPQLVIALPSGEKQKVVTGEAGELVTPAWGPLY
jgi:TolB protein